MLIIFAVKPKLPDCSFILSRIALKLSVASIATSKVLPAPAVKVNVPAPTVSEDELKDVD